MGNTNTLRERIKSIIPSKSAIGAENPNKKTFEVILHSIRHEIPLTEEQKKFVRDHIPEIIKLLRGTKKDIRLANNLWSVLATEDSEKLWKTILKENNRAKCWR